MNNKGPQSSRWFPESNLGLYLHALGLQDMVWSTSQEDVSVHEVGEFLQFIGRQLDMVTFLGCSSRKLPENPQDEPVMIPML